MKVGENPGRGQCVALELHTKAVTHGAVRPVAADHPIDVERLLLPVRMTQECRDGVLVGDERVNSTRRSTCTPSEFR